MSASGNYIPKGVTFETFDPNCLFGDKPLWGVLNCNKFKTYTQRGHALNGFHNAGQGKLYTQTATGWVLLAVKDGHNWPEFCENCGAGTKGPDLYRDGSVRSGRVVNTGGYVFRRRGGKVVDPVELLFVCKACKPVVSS